MVTTNGIRDIFPAALGNEASELKSSERKQRYVSHLHQGFQMCMQSLYIQGDKDEFRVLLSF